jgi:hypothetical protein
VLGVDRRRQLGASLACRQLRLNESAEVVDGAVVAPGDELGIEHRRRVKRRNAGIRQGGERRENVSVGDTVLP